ncbi:MAG TPA: arsenate reductase (azurin) small subunit, partial [Acidimicrobiia bacterium]|nr:arsenate reductase (azurin) small subunit [Acidimicrobiia bacterium]
MAGLTRREFLLIGAAGGAVAAVGVVIPLTRQAGEEVSIGVDDGPDAGPPRPPTAAVVGFFPKLRVAAMGAVRSDRPITFEYPLQGQRNILVKLDTPVPTGIGPDQDIVAFSSICTHMGCVLEEYRPEHRALGPCPCHFSTFDLAHDGMVTLGQATQNLPQVVLTVEDDDIYAVGVLRLVYGFANTLQGAPTVEV